MTPCRTRAMTPCRACRLASLALVSFGFLVPTGSKADVVERVAAVVNDQAIFLSDLRARVTPFLSRLAGAPEAQRPTLLEGLYRDLLEELISEELFRQKATELDLHVTTEDIDRAVQSAWRTQRLSEEEFWERVRSEGYSESQYRDDVRRFLLRSKVLNQLARGRVNITEADVRRRYESEIREATRQLRFRASHVFVRIPEGATATEVAALRAEAVTARAGLTADSFLDTAQRVGGGELGWLTQGDLPQELDEALAAMQPGQISDVIRGPNGFHMLLLHERERGDQQIPRYEQVRETVYRTMLQEAMVAQERQLLEELRRQAIVENRL